MKRKNLKFKIQNSLLLLCSCALFWLAGRALAAQPVPVEIPKAESTEPNVIETACELIYQGHFSAAGELIQHQLGASLSSIGAGQSSQDAQSRSTLLSGLARIVQEYRAISQRRQSAREAAYQQQLAELEKFQVAADTNDVNDINDIPVVFSVLAKACEFANEQQKQQLLSESFVKHFFRKAKTRATEFESKGEWLDAYINCYYWLQVIDPNNKAYSDYAEQLWEKNSIVASFQDSPCESREDRFHGVKKQMFVRAINTLKFNYIGIPDYGQMATKAIRRCKLLAEVVNSSSVVHDALYGEQYDIGETQYDKKLAAWSAALAAVLDEVNQSPTGMSKDRFIDVFEKVLALNTTIAQLPRPVLIVHFAEAALSALDPYTVMVWPGRVQDFEKEMTKEFTGIGIEISKEKGLLTVASLLPDTPAYNSGLDAGDVIEAVDGVETKDMSLMCAVRGITGPAGTKVTLTIRRPGEDETRDIIITRAKIIVPPIRGWQRTEAGKWLYMIDDANRIGYVRITNFDLRTAPDLEKVLGQLEAKGLKGLILDLRFNSGGLLDSAAAVTDKFLKEGLIVSTHPRFGVWTWRKAREEKTHLNFPLVVLINSSSASASEIVAGALADPKHNRAILVGKRTYGKGSVQGITRYPGGGAQLKYTMAYYHLPSGQRVETRDAMKKRGRGDWGVGPNIEVKLRSDELRRMIDVQRDNDVLVKANADRRRAPLKKHTIEETLAADPQLAVAALVIKSKLIQAGNSG